MENVSIFLEELTKLTEKYKISIDGCGCCGSPFLREMQEQGNYACIEGGSDLEFMVD